MKTIAKYTPFIASAMLMCVLLFIIYPNYQYYIDPDGTAYLTIAKRYAAGDYLKAINGYWSPWACWLSALLIKKGLMPMPASVIVNAAGAIGFLYISHSLFLRFGISKLLQWLFNLSLSTFLCYAIFWQSFDDLWECFFLLSALRMMLADNFVGKPLLWISTGIAGALAYFSKAYAFPFFILSTACCVYFISNKNTAHWAKICAVSIGAMILFSLPWIYLLHQKYGIWTTSTSGSLNMSWYLVGHPHWKAGITHLLPPAYPDSPYYWEDPYAVNGNTPHFWNSWHLFGRQFLRIGLNLWKLLVSSLQLSLFFPAIAIVALFSLRNQKLMNLFSGDLKIVVLSFLLFPLGYVLVNFESRYLWYMVPPIMILGSTILKNIKVPGQKMIAVLLPLSFIVWPLWGLSKMNHVGYNEYWMSGRFEAMGIHGSFTSITHAGKETQQLARLAYFSGNSYYNIPDTKLGPQEILADMRRYKVKYYIHFSSGANDHFQLLDEQGKPFPQIDFDKADWIKVFLVNP